MVVQNQGVPPDVRIWEFGRTLAGAGYQVDVIAPRRSGQLPQETVDGMRVHRFAASPWGGGALRQTGCTSFATLRTKASGHQWLRTPPCAGARILSCVT